MCGEVKEQNEADFSGRLETNFRLQLTDPECYETAQYIMNRQA
jgi:hypothetical protein